MKVMRALDAYRQTEEHLENIEFHKDIGTQRL